MAKSLIHIFMFLTLSFGREACLQLDKILHLLLILGVIEVNIRAWEKIKLKYSLDSFTTQNTSILYYTNITLVSRIEFDAI